MNALNSFVSVMPVPLDAAESTSGAGSHPTTVPLRLELKGTTVPVIAVMIPTCSLEELAAALEAKVGSARAFFEGEAALLDVSRCDFAGTRNEVVPHEAGEVSAIDYAALATLVRGCGMTPVAVRGAPDADVEHIRAAGLAVVAGVAPVRVRPGNPVTAVVEAADAPAQLGSSSPPDVVQGELSLDEPDRAIDPASRHDAGDPEAGRIGGTAHTVAEADRDVSSTGSAQTAGPNSTPLSAGAPAAITPEIGAMVIDKALRSGQRVYAKGRDLVVLAQVNPGAELIADGSIHCYAPLRGRAVAGANGNTKATIFAANFQAELVSIAGVYKNFETIPAEVAGRQMCVRLREQDGASRIALEPLNTE